MILTDTHSHLHFKDFEGDASETLARARENGVTICLCVGTQLECSRQAVLFAEKHENVFAAVGCHPHDSKDFREEDYEAFKSLARHPKVVGIGEVGLDFFRNLSPREVQEKVFRTFIRLHKETGLPLILHIRDAHAETFRVLEEDAGSPVRGVMHCFSGDRAVLEKASSMGLWVSFAGNVTYKKNAYLREVLPHVPKDKILTETDCPFLPPEGFRGKRNEPAFVRATAMHMAGILGLGLEEFAELTSKNARELFRLPAEDGRAGV